MENITFYSSDVLLAEESHPDYFIAKFIISGFGRNGNGVSISRDNAETWISTLKDMPLVGKVEMKTDGTYDFTGHNMQKVIKTDSEGNEYEAVIFNTDAFGTFVDVSIEEIEKVEYIVATCKIWKRFELASNVILSRIKNSELHTSWEISTEKTHKGLVDGLITKIIDCGRFIGHALLGKDIKPAFSESGLLEIASTNYDELELSTALSQDIINLGLDIKNEEQEEKISVSKIKKEVAEEEVKSKQVEETPVDEVTKTSEYEKENNDGKDDDEEIEDSKCGDKKEKSEEESETQTSSLTMCDLREKLQSAVRSKIKYGWVAYVFPAENYCLVKDDSVEGELEYSKFTYSVESDEITLGEPEKVTLAISVAEINSKISSKNEAIVNANEEIQTLKAEISTLLPYKERCEKEDIEKAENEIAEKKENLKQYALNSKQITEAEIETDEFKTIISELNEAKLKSIVADRVVASLSKKEKIETSEVKEDTPKANLSTSEDNDIDALSIMKTFLRK